MPSRHRVSRAAIDLLKRFEGYRRQAAQLPDGRWTLGYGHTLTAREGAEVSEPDAEALLLYDLIAVQHAINESVFTPLGQNQFDALASFVFNIGLDNFRRSRVLKELTAGSMVQAACAMELWRKADFEGERIVVDALIRRRAAEKGLFLTPPGGAWTPAPSPILRPVLDIDATDVVPAHAPVTLETSLEGHAVVLSREPVAADAAQPDETSAPLAAVTRAAEAVTQRLETLFADPGQDPEFFDALPAPTSDLPEVSEPTPADSADSTDAELDIPQAPAFQRYDRADQPRVEMEVAPFAFIPARTRPTARRKEPSIAWDLSLMLLGLTFFGFGLVWGLYARPTGGTITPLMVSWPAGMAGIGFAAVASYRLLQRLGREAERD